MTKTMARSEYDALPVRSDVKGQYVPGLYRPNGADSKSVYEYQGDGRRDQWACFGVDFQEDK